MRRFATLICALALGACTTAPDWPGEEFHVCDAGDIGCVPSAGDEPCLPGTATIASGICAEIADDVEGCLGTRPVLTAVGEAGGRCTYECETDGECGGARTGYDHALWCTEGTCGWQ